MVINKSYAKLIYDLLLYKAYIISLLDNKRFYKLDLYYSHMHIHILRNKVQVHLHLYEVMDHMFKLRDFFLKSFLKNVWLFRKYIRSESYLIYRLWLKSNIRFNIAIFFYVIHELLSKARLFKRSGKVIALQGFLKTFNLNMDGGFLGNPYNKYKFLRQNFTLMKFLSFKEILKLFINRRKQLHKSYLGHILHKERLKTTEYFFKKKLFDLFKHMDPYYLNYYQGNTRSPDHEMIFLRKKFLNYFGYKNQNFEFMSRAFDDQYLNANFYNQFQSLAKEGGRYFPNKPFLSLSTNLKLHLKERKDNVFNMFSRDRNYNVLRLNKLRELRKKLYYKFELLDYRDLGITSVSYKNFNQLHSNFYRKRYTEKVKLPRLVKSMYADTYPYG